MKYHGIVKDRQLKKTLKQYLNSYGLKAPVCKAPFVSMSVGMTGFVSPCCYTQSYHAESFSQERYPTRSLMEIWKGDDFQNYRNQLKHFRFPSECEICEGAIRAKRFESSKMRMYEGYQKHKKFPVMLEIAVDNTCNLECVMCNSLLSSKIAQREGVKFDNGIDLHQFKMEFFEFIPYLQEAIFSGGESFLSRTYIDIWKEIIAKNPSCRISVNTNGSVLTDEIKDVLEAGNFHFNLSIDSVNKTTYEQIRKGASFEKVMEHLDYFLDYAQRNSEVISMPVCPLTLNAKEFPDIVRFCNQRGMRVDFQHVFNAYDVALQYASKSLLEESLQICQTANFDEDDEISLHNIQVLRELEGRIKTWINDCDLREAWMARHPEEKSEFDAANVEFEQRIFQYLQVNFPNENVNAKFDLWKQKKDALFDVLPEYFKNSKVFMPLFALRQSVWYDYLFYFPVLELKHILMSYAERIMLGEK